MSDSPDRRAGGKSDRTALRPGTPNSRHPAGAIVGFVVRFGGVWIVALVTLILFPQIGGWIERATVENLVLVASWIVRDAASVGSQLRIGDVSLQIVPDCTSLTPTILLCATMLAFPATIGWKSMGMLVGALILWVYNLMRVLALVLVLSKKPSIFEFVHVYLWQTATVLVVVAIFAAWLRLQRPSPSK